MEKCVFCKIVSREVPAEIVFEDDLVLGFRDVNPLAPVHILLVPKRHINPKAGISDEHAKVFGNIFLACSKVAESEGIAKSGFRVISNVGDNAGQEVEHLHFHLLGGEKLGPMLAKNS